MDERRARQLLHAETERLQQLLQSTESDSRQNRATANDQEEADDSAEPLHAEGVDNALSEQFQQRLEAVQRAEQRLVDGTYGRSIRSGDPIPDERLEADPAAELTVEEATLDEQG
jgi:DnaK suppressor protein